MKSWRIETLGTVAALVGLVIFTAHGAWASELSPNQMRDIARAGDRLLRAFPDPNTVFIGIGQSPQVVLAYLESRISAQRAISVPLSGTRNLDLIANDLNIQDHIGEFMQAHLKYFAPAHTFQGNRTYVVFDYSISGSSMKSNRKLFEQAFVAMGLKPSQLRFVALMPWFGTISRVRPQVDLVLTISTNLSDELANRNYRDFHPYDKLYLIDLITEHFREGSRYVDMLEDAKIASNAAKRAELVNSLKQSQRGFSLERCWQILSSIGLGATR